GGECDPGNLITHAFWNRYADFLHISLTPEWRDETSWFSKSPLHEVADTMLQELLTEELKDLLHAESQLVKALPKMAKAANSEELKTAFEEHLEQTKGHVERLH